MACNSPTSPTKPLFVKQNSGRTGITFKNTLRETEAFNVMTYGYFYNGGGVAVGDVNQDSLPDLYFTANLMASHLYLNQGDFSFKNVAAEAGVEAAGLWNTGTAMADVNGDGLLDIYVCRSAASDPEKRKNQLFINLGADQEGVPHFEESGEKYGLADPAYSTHASFFDYDRDGDLDMYLLNHSVPEYAGFSRTLNQFKQQTNPYYGDKLYRNDGESFTDVTAEAGITSNVLGFGLGVAVSDVNGDGWLDLYISNDYNEQDYLYLNQQDGTFREGLADLINHTSLFSMGSDIADINNDALPDIYTLDMLPKDPYRFKMSSGADNFDKHQVLVNSGFYHQYMRNMLQLNLGDSAFSEIGQLAGVSNSDWSWSALFADYDLDGWKDLFITNGYKADYTNMDFLAYSVDQQLLSRRSGKEVAVADLLARVPAIEVANQAYKNNGDLTFREVSDTWGLDQVQLSNGAAYGDFDRDGDLDLVINNVNELAAIYENQAVQQARGHYIHLHLEAAGKNTHGVGARVKVETPGQTLFQELIPSRGFQSSVAPMIHMGLGADSVISKMTLFWPDGAVEVKENVPVDRELWIRQTSGEEQAPTEAEKGASFLSVADDFLFRHSENAFVDFKQQPLMPRMLSTLGPKMATADINGDGRTDVFIGGARNQAAAVLTQQANGTFVSSRQPSLARDALSEDLGAAWLDADGDGDQDLWVVSGGSAAPQDAPEMADRLYLNDGRGFLTRSEGLPVTPGSGSCVAIADVDGDGDPDAFVGGRQVPGRFPEAPDSYLWINDGTGRFTDETDTWAPELRAPGMVTDAQWMDLNEDGKPDLVICGDWMPIKVFLNTGRTLEDQTDTWLPRPLQGWWNCLHAADIDQDGDLDLLAGNEGLNTQCRVSEADPATLHYKDFDGNGSMDPIMSYPFEGTHMLMPYRDDLLGQLVPLKKKFTSYDAYARAEIEDVFSPEELAGAQVRTVNIQESIWLESTGQGFAVHLLPKAAQFAPVFAFLTLDINKDDHLDMVTLGNFSATRVQFGRNDANWGQLFLGDGRGSWSLVPQAKSGLRVRGDVRSAALVPGPEGMRVLIGLNDAPVQVYRMLEPPVQ